MRCRSRRYVVSRLCVPLPMAESLSMRGVHDASQGPESVRRTSGENDASPRTMEQPSEGGLVGWLQVAGSFALYFNHL